MSTSWSGSDSIPEQPWQGRRNAISRFLRSRPFKLVGLAALLILFLALFVIFILSLLYRLQPTPLVTIEAGQYRWPFPPNAWASEDIDDLAFLDKKTISIIGQSGLIQRSQDVLDAFGQGLTSEADRASKTAVAYISMHGVFDGETLYLVPPGGAPLDPSTWIKVDQLIDAFNSAFPDSVNKLVVLDCNRMRANWHVGLPHNDFSTGLKTWWEMENGGKSRFPKVAILNSAGPGERGWSSADIQGSVFGHFFRLGIAGDADAHARDRRFLGSNPFRPPTVTLDELHQYLDDHVSAWVLQNKGDVQHPMLLRQDENFVVASALNPRKLRSLVEQDAKLAPAVPAVTFGDRDTLWEALDEFRLARPYRYEPLAWRDLEHQLLWLEQLASSGKAYTALAERTSDELRLRIRDIKTRKSAAGQNQSVRARGAIITGNDLQIPEQLRVRSLPLGEYFGTVKPGVAAAVTDTLRQFRTSPSEPSLDKSLLSLEQLGVARSIDYHFLHMLQRYQFPRLWQQSTQLIDLLNVRDRAERLAVPGGIGGGDERVHYWVRAVLSGADETRRTAEDQLFIDGSTSLNDYLSKANSEYEKAEQAAKALSDAIQIRDQAWAEIPYLAEWLTDPLRTQETWQSDDARIQDNLLPLIEATSVLGGMTANHAPLENGNLALDAVINEIVSDANKVNEQRKTLRGSLTAECKQLSDRMPSTEISDGVKVRRIEAALRNPLISPTERSELRKRQILLTSRLRERSIPAKPDDRVSDNPAGNPRPDWMERPGRQVPLVLLKGGTSEPSTGQGLDLKATNSQWRQGIDELLRNLATLDARYAAWKEGDKLDERELRRDWSILERRLRAVAPIWFPKPKPNVKDPIQELQRIDLVALLLWHGQRSLDDFWGSAGRARPFFEIATRDYLDSAEQLLTSYTSINVSALDTRLWQLRKSAMNWMKTKDTTVVLLEPGEEINSQIAVQPLDAVAGLPAGDAALFLRRDVKRLGDVVFAPLGSVPLPAGKFDINMTVPGGLLQRQETGLSVEAMFRGHEFPGAFHVETLGGVVVSHEPHVYQRGEVTLHNPWKKMAVVFVLDSSRSMETQLEAEESRLNVAKEALSEMLSRLAARRNVRVGVRFFGHRLGWSTDRPVRVLTSPTYLRDIPSDLKPEEDVEQVLTVGDFDFAAARHVYQELDAIEAWGQSPLYLSLERALSEDFVSEDAETERHIVVITDGENYQFRPLLRDQETVDNVVQAGQQRQVSIHILGLAMDAEPRRAGTAEFSLIAERTQGIFRNINSSTDLLTTLKSIFEPEMYQLQDAGGRVVDEGQLGTPLYEERAPENGRWYFVNFRESRETVWLEGGEVLPFYMRPGSREIFAFAYDHDVAFAAPLVPTDGQPASDQVVRFHKPIRSDDDVHFPISLQRQDHSVGWEKDEPRWRWTRRPAEAWVEISPRLANGTPAGQSYIFYDANYEPDKPVPELKLVAHQWPNQAMAARIQVWFKTQPTNPSVVIPLSQVVGNGQKTTSVEVQGVVVRVDAGGVGERPGLYRLRVVERHDSRSTDMGTLKIFPPLGNDVRPARIVRQFDEEHGLVVHSYYYPQDDPNLVDRLKTAEIGIAARTEANRDALRLATEAALVEISDAGNLIPLATR